MALARLAPNKNLLKISPMATFFGKDFAWDSNTESLLGRFLSTSADQVPMSSNEGRTSSDNRDVAVSEQGDGRGGSKRSRFLPSNFFRRRRGLSSDNRRDRDQDIDLFDVGNLFRSGFGDSLFQVSENLNRLFDNVVPSNLFGQIREHDDKYTLKYELPGLAKEDVKITVQDGYLDIKGEHKEHEKGNDIEGSRYGYYEARVVLPEDAKVDEIKAEMNHGVLRIILPRTERTQKDVREVTIQ